jgi:hypothetical protein
MFFCDDALIWQRTTTALRRICGISDPLLVAASATASAAGVVGRERDRDQQAARRGRGLRWRP